MSVIHKDRMFALRHFRLFGTVLDAGCSGAYGYLCMPLFPMTLDDALRMKDTSPLDWPSVTHIFTQLAEAVACQYNQ